MLTFCPPAAGAAWAGAVAAAAADVGCAAAAAVGCAAGALVGAAAGGLVGAATGFAVEPAAHADKRPAAAAPIVRPRRWRRVVMWTFNHFWACLPGGRVATRFLQRSFAGLRRADS